MEGKMIGKREEEVGTGQTVEETTEKNPHPYQERTWVYGADTATYKSYFRREYRAHTRKKRTQKNKTIA